MLKKTITYQNPFTEKEVTEEHYFHISKADLIEMQMENMDEPEVVHPETGQKLEGFLAMLQRVINDKDGKAVLVVVKDMVRRSYGKKEGDRFVRSPEIWEEFASTEAWAQLYFELCTDAGAQADFMNGVFPRDMLDEANKLVEEQAQNQESKPETNGDPTGLTQDRTPRVLSTQEIVEMDSDELKAGLSAGRFKLA